MKWLFFIGLFLPLLLAGQTERVRYVFKHVSREEGFPANYVYEFMQDRQGYIWMGTDLGLARYDGESFLFFQNPPPDSNTSMIGQITRMYEDRRGYLWFIAQDAHFNLNALNLSTRQIHYCMEGGKPIEAFGFYEFGDDFFVLTNSGIRLFDRQNFQLGPVLIDSTFAAGPGSFLFNGIDRNGRTWGWGSKGLFCYDPKEKALYHRGNNPHRWTIFDLKESPNKFYWEHGGNCWISCVSGNFYYYDFKSGQVFSKKVSEYRDKLNMQRMWSIAGDKAGNVWFPTEDGKICRYFVKQDSFDCISESYIDRSTLSGTNSIFATMADREGNIWIEVHGGADFFNPASQHITTLRPSSVQSGFGAPFISDFVETPSGDVFVSHHYDGIKWYDAQFFQKGELTYQPGKSNSLPWPVVYTLNVSEDGKLWIGGANDWIGTFDPASRRLSKVRCEPCQGRLMRNIHRASNGDLWFNPWAESLVKWDARLRRFEGFPLSLRPNYPISYEGEGSNFCMFEENENKLWLGTAGYGVILYDPQTQTVLERYHYNKLNKPVEFNDNFINNIIPCGQDSLLVGTHNGLKLLDKRRKTFERLVLTDKMPNVGIKALQWDDAGRLWFTTTDRLCVTDSKFSNVTIFNWSDGLLQEPYTFTVSSLYKLRDGRMLVGTDVGSFMVFHPDSLIKTQRPLYAPVIADFKIFDEYFPVDSFILSNRPLVLPHDRNSINITYASLTYSNPDITYQYWLEGLETKWIEAGKRRFVNYPALPPGDYVFHVRALTIDGRVTEPTSLTFVIRPPWYQTSWFYILLALTLSGIGYAVVRDRIRRFRERASYEKRLSDLQNQALRAQINPHFIFNALQSVKKFVLENDVEQAEHYMSRFAQLMRQIMDNSREAAVSLRRELDLLDNYLQLEQLRFGHAFDYRFELADDFSPEDVEVPSMMLQPFAENAVLHGLAHLRERRGLLLVRCARRDEGLFIEIEDNGVGRARAEQLKNPLRRQLHRSAGMDITARRLALFSENAAEPARFAISDLHDEAGNPAGTQVEIWLPMD